MADFIINTTAFFEAFFGKNSFFGTLYLIAILVSFVGTIYLGRVYKRLYRKDEKGVRGWSWIFVGILGILLFNISGIYMLTIVNDPQFVMYDVIGRTLIGLTVTVGAILIYSPMKKGFVYGFMALTPVTEAGSDSTSTALTEIVKKGQSYLIDEEKPVNSIRTFVNLVMHGVQGLYITRRFPKDIREEYNLRLTPIIWLTKEKTDESHIDPTDIIELSHTIKEFIKKTDDGVVLLDGMEYLITQNEFKDILKLIQSLNDSIAVSSSRLVVAIDHSTLTEQQFHLLKKELKVFSKGLV